VASSPAALAQTPGQGATVRFASATNGNRYTVSAQGQTCDTPCTLNLAPGSLAFETHGAGKIHRTISISAGAWSVKLQHFTVKELIFTSVLAGSGLILLGGGVDLGNNYGWKADNGASIGGVVLTTVGATFAGIGLIGFAFLRGEHVEVTSERF
jgi:hypothetical protein